MTQNYEINGALNLYWIIVALNNNFFVKKKTTSKEKKNYSHRFEIMT